MRDGYAAPTPVSVLGAAEIAAQAPPNIADFVNTLPSIASSGTAATNSGGLSNGLAGLNSINLRGLGVTTYGDGPNHRIGVTAGFSAVDDRLHVLLDGEYFQQDGVPTIARRWNNADFFQINDPAYTATNVQPQRLVGPGVFVGTDTSGGLITSAASPLYGAYFLGNGQTAELAFGTFNSVSSPWVIGGDYRVTQVGHQSTNSLLPTEERIAFFNRTAFDVTPDIQFSFCQYKGQSFYQQTPSAGVSSPGSNWSCSMSSATRRSRDPVGSSCSTSSASSTSAPRRPSSQSQDVTSSTRRRLDVNAWPSPIVARVDSQATGSESDCSATAPSSSS